MCELDMKHVVLYAGHLYSVQAIFGLAALWRSFNGSRTLEKFQTTFGPPPIIALSENPIAIFLKIHSFWYRHPKHSMTTKLLDKLKNLEKNTFLFCFNSKSLLITKKPNLYPTDSVDFLGNV